MKTKANFKFSKALIALVMVFMMAITAFGISQIARLTASAAEAETGTIGYGTDNKATVTLDNTAPATLTVKDGVTAGMYYMYANVTEIVAAPETDDGETAPVPGEDFIYVDLQIESSKMEWPVYLSYSEPLKTYIGVVYAEAGLEYTVTTYMDGYTYTVEFYLNDLALGALNEYYLSGVDISATAPVTVKLDNVSGDYMVVVDVYSELEDNATISVNGTVLTKNADMYGSYTGTFNLTGVSALEITTTNEDVVTIGISLREIVKAETLVMGAPIELSLWEARNFEYKATATGYYTLDVTKAISNSYVDVMLKSDPNSFVGSYLEEGYPIHFVAGQTYYFMITYTGTEWVEGVETPETATFTFNLAAWTAPTLEANNIYYVPVTNSASTAVALNVNVTGKYLVSLMALPMAAYSYGFEVTVNYNNETYALNIYNDFSTEIEFVESAKTIMFVSNQDEDFTCGVSLSEIYDTTLELGVAMEINFAGWEGRAYSLHNLPVGTYSVDIIDGNGNIMVFDTNYTAVVGYGETSGTFTVTTEVEDFILIIENNSDDDVTFSVLVQGRNTMVLGESKEITLSAEMSSVTYYIELAEGEYFIELTLPTGVRIQVLIDGEEYIGYGETDAYFDVEVENGTLALTFNYAGTDTVTFSAIVTYAD